MPLNVYLAKDNLESYVQSPYITNGYTRQLTQSGPRTDIEVVIAS